MKESPIRGHWMVYIGRMGLHFDTVIMTWVVMAILIIMAWLATRKMRLIPSGFQNLLEWAVESLQALIRDNMGAAAAVCFPVLATLFLFILFANLIGLVPGLSSPTSDINVTIGLAVAVLGLTVYAGTKTKGLKKYLLSFIKPNPLFLPLNILEMFTRTLTLAFRLFGNIFAGDVLIVILGRLVMFFVPMLGQAFHVFVSILQAYLFFMLATAYIAVSLEESD
ncbi:MAG TPA: F0F1 ATP synthase subunit A [Firmicutes bacterium]|nr:F0F1 ATP synthase subunit A [Bacillota bacterium]HHY98405.1 F0F1 ATP synthase subunit A [Bacillota bacterium]